MLMVISPAKTLDLSSMPKRIKATQPHFMEEAAELVEVMRGYDQAALGQLMHISDKLAELNHQRYADFSLPLNDDNAKPAIHSFQGDVYTAITPEHYDQPQTDYMQRHLRMLSGLYGVLRPHDYLYPYRLEMGTKLPNKRGKDMYHFWGSRVTDYLNEDIQRFGHEYVLNLASNEYSKVIRTDVLHVPWITIEFREGTEESSKIVGIHAKKARGMMVDYLVKHQVDSLDVVRAFDYVDYSFRPAISDDTKFVFMRAHRKQL